MNDRKATDYCGQRSIKPFKANNIITFKHLPVFHRKCDTVAKFFIEPKKGKDGLIDYIVTYQDPKMDNQFTLTTTNDLNEAVERLRTTLESEVQSMNKK
jgi:hypothetical protein